jgi:hypothetical protein
VADIVTLQEGGSAGHVDSATCCIADGNRLVTAVISGGQVKLIAWTWVDTTKGLTLERGGSAIGGPAGHVHSVAYDGVVGRVLVAASVPITRPNSPPGNYPRLFVFGMEGDQLQSLGDSGPLLEQLTTDSTMRNRTKLVSLDSSRFFGSQLVEIVGKPGAYSSVFSVTLNLLDEPLVTLNNHRHTRDLQQDFYCPPSATWAANDHAVTVAARIGSGVDKLVLRSWALDSTGAAKPKHEAEHEETAMTLAICPLKENLHRLVTASASDGVLKMRAWHIDDAGVLTVHHGVSEALNAVGVSIVGIHNDRVLSLVIDWDGRLMFIDWQVAKDGQGKLGITQRSTVTWPYATAGQEPAPLGGEWQTTINGTPVFAVPAVVTAFEDGKLKIVVWYDTVV